MSEALTIEAKFATEDDVIQFTDCCVFASASYGHFRSLYGDRTDQDMDLLARCSPLFFGDVSAILKEYIILQVCKLTDPEKFRGAKNLTLDFLMNNFDFSQAHKEFAQLNDLYKDIMAFREKVLPARNKIISHIDRSSIQQRLNLGAASDDDWNKFWSKLQEIVNIFNELIERKGIQINALRYSDAERVIHALRQAEGMHA